MCCMIFRCSVSHLNSNERDISHCAQAAGKLPTQHHPAGLFYLKAGLKTVHSGISKLQGLAQKNLFGMGAWVARAARKV